MRLRKPETHTLTGGYALHALTGTDAARFERHLARCPACAQEVREFTEATARLAEAAAALPPATLKRRVLAAAARTRQLPPLTREPAAARIARHTAAAGPAPRASAAALPGRPRARRLALAAAATAALVLAGILGVTARTAQDRLGQNLARSQQIAAVLTAPDATMIDARVTTGGTATVVMSRRQRALVFAAAGLSALPPSRCYELWLLAPAGDKPAGMLPAPRQDKTGPVITTGLASASRLGLSIEPAGGSPHPTSGMILILAL
jgi:anti-sigma-K factor RskA